MLLHNQTTNSATYSNLALNSNACQKENERTQAIKMPKPQQIQGYNANKAYKPKQKQKEQKQQQESQER